MTSLSSHQGWRVGIPVKGLRPEDLITAIKNIQRGEPFLHPSHCQKGIGGIKHPAGNPPTPEPLTERRWKCAVVAQGLSNQAIAEKLVIGDATVRTHIGNILSNYTWPTGYIAALLRLEKGLSTFGGWG